MERRGRIGEEREIGEGREDRRGERGYLKQLAGGWALAQSPGHGPGRMHGMGPGMHGQMGPGMRGQMGSRMMGMGPGMMGGSATMNERSDIHDLFLNHDRIKRTVTNVPDGIRTVTELPMILPVLR